MEKMNVWYVKIGADMSPIQNWFTTFVHSKNMYRELRKYGQTEDIAERLRKRMKFSVNTLMNNFAICIKEIKKLRPTLNKLNKNIRRAHNQTGTVTFHKVMVYNAAHQAILIVLSMSRSMLADLRPFKSLLRVNKFFNGRLVLHVLMGAITALIGAIKKSLVLVRKLPFKDEIPLITLKNLDTHGEYQHDDNDTIDPEILGQYINEDYDDYDYVSDDDHAMSFNTQ